MPVDADQRVLGRLVAVRRRVLERPQQVRAGVRVAQRDVDQADAKLPSKPIRASGSARSGMDGSSSRRAPRPRSRAGLNGQGTPRPSGPFV